MAKEEVLSNKEDQVVNLQDYRRGFDSGTIDPNWLKKLKEGTVFLVQGKKDMSASLGEFAIKFHSENGATLLVNPTQQEVWQNSSRFCRDYDMFEILFVPPEHLELPQEEEKEETETEE